MCVAAQNREKFTKTLYYEQKQLLLSARLSHRTSVRLSVRPSVTWVDQSNAKL